MGWQTRRRRRRQNAKRPKRLLTAAVVLCHIIIRDYRSFTRFCRRFVTSVYRTYNFFRIVTV